MSGLVELNNSIVTKIFLFVILLITILYSKLKSSDVVVENINRRLINIVEPKKANKRK